MSSCDYYCGTREYSRCWLNTDFGGLFPFELGEVVLAYAVFFLSKCVLPVVFHTPLIRCLLYSVLFFVYAMAVISHFRCCFSDPGCVPSSAASLPSATEEEKMLFCTKCGAYKPPRAHHCSQCNRCIIRMDHHCPWVNNCIGYRNMKFFVLFLSYVVLMCILTFVLDCFKLYDTYLHVADESTAVIVGTMLTMSLSCMFVGFAGSMLNDALSTIRSDTTAIDKLKGVSFSEEKSGWEVYFGDGKGSWRWFIPVSPHVDDLEAVCGYCVKYCDVYPVCGNGCLTRVQCL